MEAEGEHSEERAAPRRDVRSRTSVRFRARSRRNPARLIAAGGRQGGTERVGVRFRELGARGAAIHASKSPVLVQAGAEPHLALEGRIGGKSRTFPPAGAETAVVYPPFPKNLLLVFLDALPRS